jgi:hypothetical protein
MTLTPGDSTHGYQLEAWTQHWRRIDGRWYRDAVAVRLSDGARRVVAFPEVTA